MALLYALQILTLALAIVAFALAFAHALELPGKMRLDKEAYLAVQRIYYPGFTIGGASEPLGAIACLALLLATPAGNAAFWLTLVALLGLLGTQAVYWLVTHPANKVWVQGAKLDRLGAGFFSVGSDQSKQPVQAGSGTEWTHVRDRWEYSHVVRAALSAVSVLALILSLGSDGSG